MQSSYPLPTQNSNDLQKGVVKVQLQCQELKIGQKYFHILFDVLSQCVRQEKNNGGLCTRHGGGGVGHNMAEKLVVFLFSLHIQKMKNVYFQGVEDEDDDHTAATLFWIRRTSHPPEKL